MSDLSPEMQRRCHRVSQQACDTIKGIILDTFGGEAMDHIPPPPRRTPEAEQITLMAARYRSEIHRLERQVRATRMAFYWATLAAIVALVAGVAVGWR